MDKNYYKDKFENENENYVQKTESPKHYKKWKRCQNCISSNRIPTNVTVLCTDCLRYLGYITYYDFDNWFRCDDCIDSSGLEKSSTLNRCVDCQDKIY